MGNLTKDFSSHEFACSDNCGFDEVSIDLVLALQKLRNNVDVPITITSGCRCKSKNEKVGGASNSYHLTGEAADIVIRGMTVKEMYWEAIRIPEFLNGGIGAYPGNGFIHVDVRSKQARWGKRDGQYTSLYEAIKENES